MRRACLPIPIVMVMSLALTNSAWALDTSWQAGTGNWSNGSNWTGAEPTSSDLAQINNGGMATIDQLGEECRKLYLGYTSHASGAVEMVAGELSVEWWEYIGGSGTGTFTQTGGTHTVGSDLRLSYGHPNAVGNYELSAGQLITGSQYLGTVGTGTFTQTGGSNTTGYFSVNDRSRYELSGGSLTVNSSARVLGTLDFTDGTAPVTMGGMVDLVNATVMGAGSTPFTLNPDSLLIVPAGFDPATVFGSFTNHGLVLQHGSTVVVPPGKGFRGWGKIEGMVECQGTINARPGLGINLRGGLYVSGNGKVDLDFGPLDVENVASGISSGQLFAAAQIIGYFGTGTFTQSGGENTVAELSVGPRRSGTYNLTAGTLTFIRSGSLTLGGTGVFNLGDASGTGAIIDAGPGDGVNMSVGRSGTFRGWGPVGLTGTLKNNGRIIADGYATDAALDLSNFSSVAQGDGTTSGWYAQNRGKLILPPISVATGSNTYNWGEDPGDTTIDLVNSVRMALTNVTSADDFSIDLLSVDHGDVPRVETGSLVLISVWDFSPPVGFAFDSADLTFRYDDVATPSWGDESLLRVYHYTGGHWADVTSSIDTTHNWIDANDLTSFSLYAIGLIPNQWQPTDGISYNNPANWTEGTVPDDANAVANFLGGIEEDGTVEVELPVTVHTVNFSNPNSYTITGTGPGQITLATSGDDAPQINVQAGDHTITVPLSFAGGLIVDTQPATSLTLDPAGVAMVAAELTKEGTGTLVLPSGVDMKGALTVNGGVVQTGANVLAGDGGPINLNSGATLSASGFVTRLVYGDLTTQIVPEGNLIIGDASGGYTYGGQVQTGPYSVTLVESSFPKKDATGTVVEGGAKIPGAVLGGPTAELGSTNGMHLLGVDWDNMDKTMLKGEGTIHGWLAAGDPVGGLGWIEPGEGKKITFTGNLQGSYAVVGDVEVLGQEIPSWSPGPSYNFKRPTIGALTLNVAGSQMPYIPLEVDPNADPIVTDPAEGYSVVFVSGGSRATGETLLNGLITVRFDPDEVAAGNPYEIQPHDYFYLVWSGPSVVGGEHLDAAVLKYGPGFGLDLPDLTPYGWQWSVPTLTQQYVKVGMVPEPSTLVLLATGGLGLLLVWRRKVTGSLF